MPRFPAWELPFRRCGLPPFVIRGLGCPGDELLDRDGIRMPPSRSRLITRQSTIFRAGTGLLLGSQPPFFGLLPGSDDQRCARLSGCEKCLARAAADSTVWRRGLNDFAASDREVLVFQRVAEPRRVSRACAWAYPAAAIVGRHPVPLGFCLSAKAPEGSSTNGRRGSGDHLFA